MLLRFFKGAWKKGLRDVAVFSERAESDRGLDSYLSRNTNEDDASFAEILKENQKKHELKHAWLYEQEQERKEDQEKALALPSVEQQAAIEGPRTQELQTWEYTAKNALMYVPEGMYCRGNVLSVAVSLIITLYFSQCHHNVPYYP